MKTIKETDMKRIYSDYWDGYHKASKDILKLIDEDIKIQKDFLKEPGNERSIEWRITGMELLKKTVKGE